MKRGGLSHINYRETKGLKASAGERVNKGAILTREGGKWKGGLHVGGRGTLYALEAGKVYFTHRKASYKGRPTTTVINIEKLQEKKSHK